MAHPPIPELKKSGHAVQLHVDGRPFLAIGGELGNSNASNLAVLEVALAKCARMNLNTVMLPVYWDLVEPVEGEFDFSLVRGAIDLARGNDIRLVPLWFGTWKNSMSCYAPRWVKRDTTRFERVRRSNGEAVEIISPLSTAACEADARAFAALMRWIRSYDEQTRTVIMVQVENEIGMIPEPRDHSPAAERAYGEAVPDALLSLAASGQLGPEVGALWEKAGRRTAGSWADVFGSEGEGEEVFSAWHFASFTERVTAAGKREYPLPMFANAALIRPGYRPGQYPSAGPLPHLLEVWRAAAPSLDMLCPDIYFPNFIEWCDRYVRSGNPLFIPEMAASLRAPANALYAIAHFNAIGVGPFSIEHVDDEKEEQIGSCFAMLRSLSDRILAAQSAGTIVGLSPQVGFDWSIADKPERAELAGIVFEAKFDRPALGGDVETTTLPTLGAGRWDAPPATPPGAAMILKESSEQDSAETFLIAGSGVTITFAAADGVGSIGIDRVHEGRFTDDGTWLAGRWLNGDETHQGRHVHLPPGRWTVQRVTLYRY